MKVRLCPYCDHEMKKAHRCDFCNSFVWKAEEVDIHYNAETRGLGEEDCSYGEAHDSIHHYDSDSRYRLDTDNKTGSRYKSESVSKVNAEYEKEKERMKKKLERERSREQRSVEKVYKKSSGTKNTSTAVKIARIIVIFVIIGNVVPMIGALFGSVFDSISDGFSSIGSHIAEPMPEPGYAEPIEDNDTYMSEESLSGYSGACTAVRHVSMDGEYLVSLTEKFLSQHYPEFETSVEFYGYDTPETNEVLYEYQYYTIIGEYYDEYVSINYDALTSEVHSLSAEFKSKDVLIDYVLMVLHDAYDAGSVTKEELLALIENEESSQDYCKECSIYLYESSDGYYVSMNPERSPYSYAAKSSFEELTQQQVMDLGQECSRLHFDILAADCSETVSIWLSDHGYTYTEYEEMYNTITVADQLGDFTYEDRFFGKYYEWLDDSREQGISIEADTYSDRIHYIKLSDIHMEDAEDAIYMLVALVGAGDADTIIQECLDGFSSDGYAFVEFDRYELYMTEGYERNTFRMELTVLR